MSAPRVALAGSTGSIGTQTLEVLAAEPDRFELTALGASGRQTSTCWSPRPSAFRPKVVAVADDGRRPRGRRRACRSARSGRAPTPWPAWPTEADVVVNGVVGFAGLPVTLATLEAGRRLALANKESLIAAGPVVQRARRTPGAELVPVDSEHCAIHQCLRANDDPGPGGPARAHRQRGPVPGPHAGPSWPTVTIDDALAHPTWSMGPKITVDSSTLMNKGLEVIEAHELFGAPAGAAGRRHRVRPDRGGGPPAVDRALDGRVHRRRHHRPALDARHAPAHRVRPGLSPTASPPRSGAIDWAALGRLDFEPPDLDAFPCLGLAYAAGRAGGTAPAWLNAANEVAVDAFLAGRIALDPHRRGARRRARAPRRHPGCRCSTP